MKWQMLFDKVSTTGDTKEKVAEKFAGLETYLGRMKGRLEKGFLTLSHGERFGYRVKAFFHLPGREIVAQGESKTLLSAIDQAYSRTVREVKQHLDKLKRPHKR